MKIRHASRDVERVDLPMTPMIDVVFQLLVFFIMNLKITALEGDFNVKMPAASTQAGPVDVEQTLPMRLRLTSDEQGKLTAIRLDERQFQTFDELHAEIMRRYMTDAGPSGAAATAEVQLDCDPQLNYEYTIAAITALSGHRDGDNIIRLVEKINFAPPSIKPSEP